MAQGVQTHRLPTDPAALETLARRCGFDPATGDPAAQLKEEIERHTSRVRAVWRKVVGEGAGRASQATGEPRRDRLRRARSPSCPGARDTRRS